MTVWEVALSWVTLGLAQRGIVSYHRAPGPDLAGTIPAFSGAAWRAFFPLPSSEPTVQSRRTPSTLSGAPLSPAGSGPARGTDTGGGGGGDGVPLTISRTIPSHTSPSRSGASNSAAPHRTAPGRATQSHTRSLQPGLPNGRRAIFLFTRRELLGSSAARPAIFPALIPSCTEPACTRRARRAPRARHDRAPQTGLCLVLRRGCAVTEPCYPAAPEPCRNRPPEVGWPRQIRPELPLAPSQPCCVTPDCSQFARHFMSVCQTQRALTFRRGGPEAAVEAKRGMWSLDIQERSVNMTDTDCTRPRSEQLSLVDHRNDMI